jgi:hypothetical protein
MKTDNLFETIEVPENLASKLETLIDELSEKESKTKRRTARIQLWAASVAASVVLCISAGLFFHSGKEVNSPFTAQSTDTLTDPEQAYAEAEKALVMVSLNFNKGLDQMAMAMNEIEKSNKKLNEILKR